MLLSLRINEHALGGSPATGYDKLFEVALQHRYYNKLEGDPCPDLEAIPSARTARFMADRGLLFRSHGAGFSVFYGVDRAQGLRRYLERDPRACLSFFLVPRGPRLLGVTEMPFDQSPLDHNYYFRNDVVAPDGPDTWSFVHGDALPIKPARFPIWYPTGAAPPVIRLSSLEATDAPDMDPPPPGTSAPPPLCFETGHEQQHDGQGTCGAYVDLSTRPEGRYTLDGGGFTEAEANVKGPQPFLHTIAAPAPFGLLDILLTQPKQGMPGVYPVDRGGREITRRRYVLRFEARQTRWVYHVAPSRPGRRFTDLVIEPSPSSSPSPAFEGPIPETLPNGAEAWQFASTMAIPLRQRSSVRLRLRGRRQGADLVLVERLPVASAEQALHWDRETGAIFSDIYVYI